MKRRLFNVVAAASLVLLVATLALWIRTFSRDDQIVLYARYSASTEPHAILFGTASVPYWTGAGLYESLPVRRNFRQFDEPFRPAVIHRQGGMYVRFLTFAYSSALQPLPPPPCRFVTIGVPLWFPIALGLVAPMLWMRKRGNVPKVGHCVICGYDLRASKDRCPECGSAISVQVAER